MLCVMHRGTPYGHLTINGMAPSNRQLAVLLRATEREIRQLIPELEAAGVFSRQDGIIYCRRMVKDRATSEEARANGRLGGNPQLAKTDPKGLTPPDNIKPAQGVKLEAESEAEAESKNYKSYLKPRVASAVPVERQEEGPPQAQWPPDPHPSAVTARVSQVATLLRKNAKAGPAPPVRTVEEQIAALNQ